MRGLGNGLESFAREAFREGVGLAARTDSREDGEDRGSIGVPGSKPSAPRPGAAYVLPGPGSPPESPSRKTTAAAATPSPFDATSWTRT